MSTDGTDRADAGPEDQRLTKVVITTILNTSINRREAYMNSTWTLVSLGDRKYRLETPSGRMLGWIHGHVVGLSGLRDHREALSWAAALRHALDDTLARHYPDRYHPVSQFADLRLVHDGAYEWIAAGNVPIARVSRISSARTERSLALEFVLPSYASERVTITSAEVLATILHERILSPLFPCETEESSHVGTAESFECAPGPPRRRRGERFARQFSRQRSTEMEHSPRRPARALGFGTEDRGEEGQHS